MMRVVFILAALSGPSHWVFAATTPPRPSNAEIFFRLENPCPATGATQGACKGYVIDRVIPIVCGGAEDPSNMRWITLAEAKAKARWDRIGCRAGRKLVLPGQGTSSTEAFAAGEAPLPIQAVTLPPGSRAPVNVSGPAEAAGEAEAPQE